MKKKLMAFLHHLRHLKEDGYNDLQLILTLLFLEHQELENDRIYQICR